MHIQTYTDTTMSCIFNSPVSGTHTQQHKANMCPFGPNHVRTRSILCWPGTGDEFLIFIKCIRGQFLKA